MAKKIDEAASEVVEIKPEKVKKAPTYPANEIIAAYEAFDAPEFLVKTAIRLSGKEQFTEAEAAKIIKDFMNKEV